jgi:hypothetical protein
MVRMRRELPTSGGGPATRALPEWLVACVALLLGVAQLLTPAVQIGHAASHVHGTSVAIDDGGSCGSCTGDDHGGEPVDPQHDDGSHGSSCGTCHAIAAAGVTHMPTFGEAAVAAIARVGVVELVGAGRGGIEAPVVIAARGPPA